MSLIITNYRYLSLFYRYFVLCIVAHQGTATGSSSNDSSRESSPAKKQRVESAFADAPTATQAPTQVLTEELAAAAAGAAVKPKKGGKGGKNADK
jgi:hypothetical protein